MKNRLLHVGKIGRAHGRFGEVRVRLFNDSYELLSPETTFFLDGDPERPIHIESVRSANKFFLIRFDGVQFRDEAQALTNIDLWVDRDALPPTNEDEYYCADLLGFDVLLQDDGDETDHAAPFNIGTVEGFLDHVETDVMIVEGPRIQNRWLVPFISSVVLDVDLKNRCITLAPLSEWAHEDQVLIG